MTKFGSATCRLFFLLWRIRVSRWSNSPSEPEGIHPDRRDGHRWAGDRGAGEQAAWRDAEAACGWWRRGWTPPPYPDRAPKCFHFLF